MATAPTTVSEYIQSFPKDTQEKLQAIRETIRDVAPEATETLSYRIGAFMLDGKYLMYFAGHSKHVAVYPIPQLPAVVEKQIQPYLVAKGTLRFALDKPLPLALIRKVARGHLKRLQAAAKQTAAKAAAKKKTTAKKAATRTAKKTLASKTAAKKKPAKR